MEHEDFDSLLKKHEDPGFRLNQREIEALVVHANQFRAERDRLAKWKQEALEVISGLQEVGKALGIRPGVQITGREAVDAALDLRNQATTWMTGWKAAMDWLAEYKGADGIALAEEMSTRLPEK